MLHKSLLQLFCCHGIWGMSRIHLQYLGSLGCEHVVVTNDELTVAELRELDPKGILLSPGPGKPASSVHVPAFHHVWRFMG